MHTDKRRPGRRARTVLIILLIVLLILLAICPFIVLTRRVSRDIVGSELDALGETALRDRDRVRDFITRLWEDMENAAPEHDPGDPAAVLKRTAERIPSASGIALLDGDGIVTLSTGIAEEGSDLSALCAGRGDRFLARTDEDPSHGADAAGMLVMSVPYGPEPEGSGSGRMLCFFPPDVLREELRITICGGEGDSCLTGPEGERVIDVSGSDPGSVSVFDDLRDAEFTGYESLDAVLAAADAGEDPAVICRKDGTGRVLVITACDIEEGYYIVSVPADMFFAQANGIRRDLIVLFAVITAVLFVVLFLISLLLRRRRQRKVLDLNEQLRASLSSAEEANRRLAEQGAFTGFFLEPFQSAYYVGLDTLSCKTYKRTTGLEDKYAVTTNYLESINDFIDHEVHPDDRETFRSMVLPARMKERLAEQPEFSYTFRTITRGETGYCRFQAIRGADADHAAFGFRVITEDVRRQNAQREQMRRALEQANEEAQRNDLIIETFDAGKWSYEVSPDDRVTGVSYPDRTIGQSDPPDPADPLRWMARLHPEDRERTEEQLRAAIADRSGERIYDVTFRILGEDGKYRWLKSAGKVFRRSDGTGEFYGMTLDITDQIEEQEQHQAQLREALSMAQSANRAKTTFLNNMSHDIRTPMNAIIGYTGLAQKHIGNSEQVKDYLDKIVKSSDHLLSLINDVLDMSRIESGKINLEEKPELLPNLIHTLGDIVQADINAKHQKLMILTENVQDECIVCDRLRLNQVLLNILSNSVKYTPEGGSVTVKVTERALKKAGFARYEFLIADNGMGMDPEFLKTIFDPFTRARSSTVSGIQGTGLGMAITKNIIDMMGGRIGIESEPGRGTRTVVTFDFRIGEMPADRPGPEIAGTRALITDTDAEACLSFYSMLKGAGLRAEWCTSPGEAIVRTKAAVRENDRFGLYLIDSSVRDSDGSRGADQIRAIAGSGVPVILIAAPGSADADGSLPAGTAVLRKPVFRSDLLRALNGCFGAGYEKPPEKANSYNFSGKRILLVEDNELNREIATEILEEDGFILDSAEDGDIAVEKMKNAKPGDYDIVLMDVQMPTMDGYEATRRIRAMGTEIARIPIIAMTANAFEEDRRAALEAGMDEHIAKPIDIARLKETLAKFI